MESYTLKPARYINREWNSVHKEWRGDILKIALCFPDIYEIGMSHLGMKIIYGILNNEKDVLCERAFAPWSDMEKKMRAEGQALFSLESKRALKEFDMVGFSLQYEMNLPDVLNMLDLGGVPVFCNERGDKDPIVIAGGPVCFNPKVMADFIDAFLIGEAEEAILEVASVVKNGKRNKSSRGEILEELSKIEGVFIPGANGTKKRIVSDLDNAYFPTAPVVPYIQIVHDRIGIEIMRGCPHRCRFCQACKIFHPLRFRSVEKILEIAKLSVKNTGYEEVSLLSLSSGDYPHIEELASKLEQMFTGTGVRVSLPSLRVRDLGKDKMGKSIKRSGLTFAPEAGNDLLRESLGKNMKNDDIIQKSNLALNSGWKKVKLYFMIGLPGETDKDLDSIIELSSEIKSVNLSVSAFIPKPHSGFEKEGMETLEKLNFKREYIEARRLEHKRARKLKIT
ncbi:MAG: radical SAM protein, partial [Candidatus Omnitrophota bacterium]|nr:radical SAM protein [Candidatus Omnitrophota bacterium]